MNNRFYDQSPLFYTLHILILLFILIGALPNSYAEKLYERKEEGISYPNSFSNPFTDTELRLSVMAPPGRELGSSFEHFGYFDGDGVGGQNGNVWKFRLLFDHPSIWTVEAAFFVPGTNTPNGPKQNYSYDVSTEKAPGERGHVYLDRNNFARLKFANGTPWIPVTVVGASVLKRKWSLSKQWIDEHAALGVNSMGASIGADNWEPWFEPDETGVYRWLLKTGDRASKVQLSRVETRSLFDYTRFDVAGWHHQEQVMDYCYSKGIRLVTWYGISSNGNVYNIEGPNDWTGSNMGPLKKLFLKYYSARFGAHPVWWMHTVSGEWNLHDIPKEHEKAVAKELRALNPWKPLITTHPNALAANALPSFNWPELNVNTLQEATVAEVRIEMLKMDPSFWRPIFNSEGYPSGSLTGAWGHSNPNLLRSILWREFMDGGFVQASWYLNNDVNNSINSWGADWNKLAPGHGTTAVQCGIQQKLLNEILDSDIHNSLPDHQLVSGPVQKKCLANPGQSYFIYLRD
ncbi:MAG: hypothetical protein WBB64_08825, partial [Anaerolineales bacterium]